MKSFNNGELLIQKKDIEFIGKYERLPMYIRELIQNNLDMDYYYTFNETSTINYLNGYDYIVDLDYLNELSKDEIKREIKALDFQIKSINGTTGSSLQQKDILNYKKQSLKEYLKSCKRKSKNRKFI